MTARELVKYLESCELDKEVAILISIREEIDDQYGMLVREITGVVENQTIITIR